jgi:hypothetical protein
VSGVLAREAAVRRLVAPASPASAASPDGDGGLRHEIDGFSCVDLAELEATAPLLVRHDRKYLVPVAAAAGLVARLDRSCQALQIAGLRQFHYESVYFDTPGSTSYLAAARRRPHRFKVRTRTYVDSGLCLLELKMRGARGHTIKRRIPYELERRGLLNEAGREFVRTCAVAREAASALTPVLVTRYVRATLLDPDCDPGCGDDEPAVAGRLTIDTDLEAETLDGRVATLPGFAIVETKSVGRPSQADRLLWRAGYRPLPVSKFATGLAVLRPELPANRWTRALDYPWQVREAVAAAAR